ncbi:MAG: hypothetical protein AAGB22_09305, partial [Bacteroidota bacterium]
QPLPAAPATTDALSCLGDPNPALTATGSNIQWYADNGLVNLVGAGNSFTPADTLAGMFPYFATQTLLGCESPADSAVLTINAPPATPVVGDTAICLGDTVPELIASGTAIRWYQDNGLTQLLVSGDTFALGDTLAGVYTFFVTDTVPGCPASTADSASITIHPIPAAPQTGDTAICVGDTTPALAAVGSNITWYSDALITVQVGTGNAFIPGDTVVGSFTYFATQRINGCEGPADSATLTIHAIPGAPGTGDTAICAGDTVPALLASGTNIRWYSDSGLTTQVGSGNAFTPGDTVVGAFTYYATQSINGCESPAGLATLTIHAIPSAPVTADTAACFQDTIPGLTATGTNITWYNDAALSTVVGSGSPFVTGDTAAGTFMYYATQTLNGCESAADSATLTIHPIPAAPVAFDTAACADDTIPGLSATGSNLTWYSDALLTNLAGTGATFVTGDTVPGTFTYFVTQTINGCEGPAAAATLTIHAIPSAPLAIDTAVCDGDTVPGLIAQGSNLTWYSDAALSTVAGSGSPFVTGDTAVGSFTYYVTETLNGCEGAADSATLTIHPVPAAPLTSDTAVCANDSIPGLSATGSSLVWY